MVKARITLFFVGNCGFAGFADLDLLALNLLLINDLHALALAYGADSPSMGERFAESLSSVCLGHITLLLEKGPA
jgi:hypothetical protein